MSSSPIRQGRPRTRTAASNPDSLVPMTFAVTAADRDEMFEVFGSGNVSNALRRAARRELERARGAA